MPVYPSDVADAIREPQFCRSVPEANATGSEAKFDCGCFVRVEMQIEGEDSNIEKIGYRTNGCGYMIAAAESVSSKLIGSSLLDLHGDLDAGSSERSDCSDTVTKAVKKAFADHRSRRLEEFRGEKALICTCFGVSEESIEQFVKSQHPTGVAEVSDAIRAGSGCGSCRMLIQEIVDAND